MNIYVILVKPGETRTEQTIQQHLAWKGLRNTVHNVCNKCDICQRTKMSTKKYGKLPPKETEAQPWEKLFVDLIGPYSIKDNKNKKLTLLCDYD